MQMVPLTKAILTGAIAAIAVPFAIGGSHAPVASLVSMVLIQGPHGATLPWSWSAFAVVTLAAWGLFAAAR
jgi:hypothetical protein